MERLQCHHQALKASETRREHSVGKQEESVEGDEYDIDKLCFFLARHIFMYGPSKASQGKAGESPYSEKEIRENVKAIIQTFKDKIEEKYHNRPKFVELLRVFQTKIQSKLEAKEASDGLQLTASGNMAARIAKWNQEKQEFFKENEDIFEFWSKTVCMPFKLHVEQRNTSDLGYIQHQLEVLSDAISRALKIE
eukprot:768114-Hanusia_phi.AAC.2